MKAKCHYCKVFDFGEGRYFYHMANITDWLPPSGYDPLLRQFRCGHCKKVFYEQITEAERELMSEPV